MAFPLYIDIIPINPYSLTAILINLYNNHYTTAITYLKPHLASKSAIGASFFIYKYYLSFLILKAIPLNKTHICKYTNHLRTIYQPIALYVSKNVKTKIASKLSFSPSILECSFQKVMRNEKEH